MATMYSKCVLLLLCAICVSAAQYDDVDIKANSGLLIKMLREMTNQSQADTLNLPANATSIRENIVDTFSCENRTYGYYADVDNECQVFHVCLPSQTTSGRNITYRWSFICPEETVFNQEVMVCTRPRDAIDCDDSPYYYELNMELGKMPEEETESNTETENQNNKEQESKPDDSKSKKPSKNLIKNQQKRKPVINNKLQKKQNLVVETLFKDIPNYEDKKEEKEILPAIPIAMVIEDVIEMEPEVNPIKEESTKGFEKGILEDSRIVSERRINRKSRKISRGTFRFKADV